MKTKDLIGVVLAIVLLGAVGVFFYNSTQAKKNALTKSTATQAEVAPVISPKLDPNNTVMAMSDKYHVIDFTQPIDLTSGLGNTNPFGQ